MKHHTPWFWPCVATAILFATATVQAQGSDDPEVLGFQSAGNIPGLGSSTHEPLMATHLASLRQVLEQGLGQFRAGPGLSPTVADYEADVYSLDAPSGNGEASGFSHNLRIAITQNSSGGKLAYGLRGSMNVLTLNWESSYEVYDTQAGDYVTLKSQADSSTLNFNGGLFGDYQIGEWGNLKLRSGGTLDYQHYGDAVADMLGNVDGMLVGVHSSLETDLANGAVANTALRLQYSSVGDFNNTTLGLAVLFNKPLTKKIDAQVSAICNTILDAQYPSTTLLEKPTDSFHVVAGIGGTYYVLPRFGINAQYRTTLGVENYANHSLQLGSRLLL